MRDGLTNSKYALSQASFGFGEQRKVVAEGIEQRMIVKTMETQPEKKKKKTFITSLVHDIRKSFDIFSFNIVRL